VSNCAGFRESLGAYVLGALEPAEVAALEAHLAECESCRREYDELNTLPPLLSLVSLEHATAAAMGGAPAPSDLVLPRVLSRARTERAEQRRNGRRRRALVSLVAAVAVVLAAATGAYVGSRFFGTARTVTVQETRGPSASPPSPGKIRETRTWSGRNPATNVSATAELTKFGWGTKVDATMNGMKKGDICMIRVVDLYGREWDAGSWIVNEKTVDLQWAGDVAVRMDNIARVEIWDGATDRRLLTLTG
jgi:Putative zinc-finger